MRKLLVCSMVATPLPKLFVLYVHIVAIGRQCMATTLPDGCSPPQLATTWPFLVCSTFSMDCDITISQDWVTCFITHDWFHNEYKLFQWHTDGSSVSNDIQM